MGLFNERGGHVLNVEKFGWSGTGQVSVVLVMVMLIVPDVLLAPSTAISDTDAPRGCGIAISVKATPRVRRAAYS
jgi:hypothetical protein